MHKRIECFARNGIMGFLILMIFCVLLYRCQPSESSKTSPEDGSQSRSITNKSDSILMKQAIRYYLKDSVTQAWENVQRVLAHANESGNKKLKMEAINLLGYIYVYWNDYEVSLQQFLQAQQISDELKDMKGEASALLGLGRTYNMMKNSAKALEVLTLALEICDKNQWKPEAAKMHLEIGNSYTILKKYEMTRAQLEKASAITMEIKDTLTTIYILNNLGEVHIHLKDFPKALQYLEESLTLNEKRGDAQAQSAVLGNLGNVYLAQGDYPKAIDYIERSIEISRRQGFKVFTKDNYKLLSNAYELNHQAPEALKYYKLFSDLTDSLFNEEKQKAIESIVFKHSQQEKDQRIAYLEQKNKNRSLLLKLTAVAIILALVVLILVVVSFRLRLKLHRKQQTEMGETLSQKNRELVSMMLQSSQKEKLLEELDKNLQKLSALDIQDLKGFAEELQDKVKSMQEIDTDWQVLKTHFEEIHPSFFQTLQARHPELTQNDLRICAYIRINLSTKDIARLIHISDRSVQTAKYRIKKKMELPSSTDLVHYIADL